MGGISIAPGAEEGWRVADGDVVFEGFVGIRRRCGPSLWGGWTRRRRVRSGDVYEGEVSRDTWILCLSSRTEGGLHFTSACNIAPSGQRRSYSHANTFPTLRTDHSYVYYHRVQLLNFPTLGQTPVLSCSRIFEFFCLLLRSRDLPISGRTLLKYPSLQ